MSNGQQELGLVRTWPLVSCCLLLISCLLFSGASRIEDTN